MARRCKELTEMGLSFDFRENSYVYHDINFHTTDLLCMSEEEWRRAIEGAKERKLAIDSIAQAYVGD